MQNIETNNIPRSLPSKLEDPRGVFESALTTLASAFTKGSSEVREVVVNVFDRDYLVPVREGGGRRSQAEKDFHEILKIQPRYKIRAKLPECGLFANLGIKWNFGIARGGYQAEVEIGIGSASPIKSPLVASVFGKKYPEKRLERIDIQHHTNSSEMNLMELANELAEHQGYTNRNEPVAIVARFTGFHIETVIVDRPVAPTFIDSLIMNRLTSAEECRFLGRAPAGGDLWLYGFHWSLSDLLGGRLIAATFARAPGQVWQRKNLEVFCDSADNKSLATLIASRPKRALIWDSSADNWIGTDLSPTEALQELEKTPGYFARATKVSLIVDHISLAVRPTNAGAGWNLFDLAFQYALQSANRVQMFLSADFTPAVSVLSFPIPTVPLLNLPVGIFYGKTASKEWQPEVIECFENSQFASQGGGYTDPVISVNLLTGEATSKLALPEFLEILARHHPRSSEDVSAEIGLDDKFYPITWRRAGASPADAILRKLLCDAPMVRVRAPLTSAGHLHVLGLYTEFTQVAPNSEVVANFSFGRRI